MKKFDWLAIVVFGVLAVLLFQYFNQVHWFWSDEIEKLGPLGDAANGITAPLITTLSAVLIYFTFKEQIKANRLLSSQTHFETYFKLFSEVEKGLSELNLEIHRNYFDGSYKTRKEIVHGREALKFFSSNPKNYDREVGEQFLESIGAIVQDLLLVFKFLENSTLEDKKYFIEKVKTFYLLKIGPHIDALNGEGDDEGFPGDWPSFSFVLASKNIKNYLSQSEGSSKNISSAWNANSMSWLYTKFKK